MNGLIKIPMQFAILLIGVLVFTFYQFHQSPLFFNKVEINKLENSVYKEAYKDLKQQYAVVFEEKKIKVNALVEALHKEDKAGISKIGEALKQADQKSTAIRKDLNTLIAKNNPKADTNDSNYIFLSFVTQQLPIGVVGLLIAIIFLASMGSMASGLNALASTTVVDFYKRLFRKSESDAGYLSASRWATVLWGLFCIVVAFYAMKLGNLIEAVNILGSLFYGTILGIFLVAFYLKHIGGTAVFYAALIGEAFIIYAWATNLMAFLWLNVIGCLLVMLMALIIQFVMDTKTKKSSM